jgi:hypothetical protein
MHPVQGEAQSVASELARMRALKGFFDKSLSVHHYAQSINRKLSRQV